jgi:hypothetical protein
MGKLLKAQEPERLIVNVVDVPGMRYHHQSAGQILQDSAKIVLPEFVAKLQVAHALIQDIQVVVQLIDKPAPVIGSVVYGGIIILQGFEEEQDFALGRAKLPE